MSHLCGQVPSEEATQTELWRERECSRLFGEGVRAPLADRWPDEHFGFTSTFNELTDSGFGLSDTLGASCVGTSMILPVRNSSFSGRPFPSSSGLDVEKFVDSKMTFFVGFDVALTCFSAFSNKASFG